MKREYWQAPLIGVGIICFKGQDVLLIERGKAPRMGSWSLPGGRQKLGETVRECARRELLQETGVQAEIGPLVDVVDSLTRDERGDLQYHYTLIAVVRTRCVGRNRPVG
jgi:8-oxo-dGTP diphosphatase